MEPYLNHFFWHCREAYLQAPKFGAKATIDLSNFVLEVARGELKYIFYPQFLVRSADNVRYSLRPDEGTRMFAGWRPYFNKRWPEASGKLAFKGFCAAQGLPTPQMWRAPADEMRDFMVKHDKTSFGVGLRGPFATYDPANPAQVIGEGGYYERFIPGRILKAWYWESQLACLEMADMPTIRGDGKLTARELIIRKLPFRVVRRPWTSHADVLAAQGLGLDTVLGEGREALADFLYGSPLQPFSLGNANVLGQLGDHPVVAQLKSFGPVFSQSIPESLRPATVYTVDAIADRNDAVWLLEMNCNPAVHPDVYRYMFERLFGEAQKEVPPPSALPPWPKAPKPPGFPSRSPFWSVV